MSTLRSLQLEHLARILDDDASVATPWLKTQLLDSRIGLEIYRNNALVGFQKALKSTYSILVQLAGEDWFNEISQLYQTRYPSRSGDLNAVGGELAQFLTAHLREGSDRYGTAYDYFPDVARLEWAIQQALSSEDVPGPDLTQLQVLLAQVDQDFSFELNPTAFLMRSAFPLYEIWSWHRHQEERAPTLDGASCVLVMKIDSHVRVQRLTVDAAALFDALRVSRPFTDAIESLNIDLPAALAELMQTRAIVDVRPCHGDSDVN